MINFKDLKKGQEIKSDQLHPFLLVTGKLLESPVQGKGIKNIILIHSNGAEVGLFSEAGSVYRKNIKLAKNAAGRWEEVKA